VTTLVDSTVNDTGEELRELVCRTFEAGAQFGEQISKLLELVADHPGITIPGLAGKMGIEPPYLYRVMPKLQSEGQVKRDGDGWHPVS
jgi:hypothetical protein